MRRWGLLATLGVLAVSAIAQAKPAATNACVSASEDGQLLKMKGQFQAAREKLIACSEAKCPKLVQKDCSAALEELERAQPTIVPSAKDHAGKDLTEVVVWLDGEKISDQLDGKAVPVDPGKHTLRFEMAGEPSHEEEFLVREGEKSRVVGVVLGKPPKKAPPKPKREEKTSASTATWIVGGAGAVVLAGAGVVGLVALNKRSSLYDSCGKAGTCSQDEVDSVYTLYNIAYVGGAVGGALLVTGGVLYFTTRKAPEQTSLVVAPSLGGVSVTGRF
jgi:hypothetical protein